jgi:O-acetyl-ADP-ribose deacetylase (regulator of RNase III)
MKITVDGIDIEIVQGNIVAQPDLDTIVNAANAQLRIGGGVAGAIHRAAGPGLEQECRPLAPISPGEAVITSGQDLPNAHVIHCLGPIYGRDRPSDVLLADCYRNALKVADENDVESIGFPAISTGAFGYPLEEAAEVALKAVKQTIPNLSMVKSIRFVLYGDTVQLVHEAAMARIFG